MEGTIHKKERRNEHRSVKKGKHIIGRKSERRYNYGNAMQWNRSTDSVKPLPNNDGATFLHAAKCWTPNDAADGCRRLQNTPNHFRESTTKQKHGGTNFYPNLGAYLRQTSIPKRRSS
jgi:hypothetical protein